MKVIIEEIVSNNNMNVEDNSIIHVVHIEEFESISNHSQLNLDDGTNPHGTTKQDVGLGSVDNTSDADKPISNATQVALNSKADLVEGKVPVEQLPDVIDISGKQDKVFIVHGSGTASNDQKYHVIENSTFTDPSSPEQGKGYEVFVRNGIATIGGVAYPVGSYVFRTYHSGVWGSQLIGGNSKKYQTLLFQSSATVTLPADQKNLHQSRFTAGTSVFSTLGLTFGAGVPETSGVLDLNYLSDTGVPNITPNYISKVVNVTLSYSRNVAESGANTNIKIRLISDTKYMTDIQKICEHVITSSTLLGNAEGKVTIPILTHLPLSANSNLKWTIRSNNGVAQQFNILRLNVDIEEV